MPGAAPPADENPPCPPFSKGGGPIGILPTPGGASLRTFSPPFRKGGPGRFQVYVLIKPAVFIDLFTGVGVSAASAEPKRVRTELCIKMQKHRQTVYKNCFPPGSRPRIASDPPAGKDPGFPANGLPHQQKPIFQYWSPWQWAADSPQISSATY